MTRLFVLCLGLCSFTLAQTPADWPSPESLTFEAIDFDPAEPTVTELSNGIQVYLLEDHSLPLVEGVAYMRAPGIYDPSDKVGLASLTASLLRDGGAGDLSPEAVDEALERLAASVEASSSDLLASVSFNALSETLDEVLPIWRDVIRAPAFDPERLEVARGRTLESIRRQNDNPVQIAAREFFFRVAEGHPSGAYATEETINAITRKDLIDFHARFYQPSVTAVAVTGDFETEAMLAKLEVALGNWQDSASDLPELPEFDPRPKPLIYFAQKDVSQTVIIIGHPSVFAYTPNYNDLDILNQILGSGFSSRLTREIRTRRGLAYSTGSQLSQGYAYPGLFFAFAFTNAEDTGQVIELMVQEIRGLQNAPVPDDELEQRRETILNRSLFRFTSAAAINNRAARSKLLGLEPGYYESYLNNLQRVTPEDLRATAQAELRPDEVVMVVVGNAEAFDKPLSDFGEVIEIVLE